MVATLNWLVAHWYVFFWLAILGVFEGVRDFFVGIAEAIGRGIGHRHEHKLEIEQAKAAAAVPTPEPGLCRHRKAVPVRNNGGDIVAWLCLSCDTPLPREFSVYEEDL